MGTTEPFDPERVCRYDLADIEDRRDLVVLDRDYQRLLLLYREAQRRLAAIGEYSKQLTIS